MFFGVSRFPSLSFPAVGGFAPVENTAKMTTLPKDVKFILDLLEPDSSQAWRGFMFNVPQASRLKKLEKSLAAKIRAAGVRFEGEGWNK